MMQITFYSRKPLHKDKQGTKTQPYLLDDFLFSVHNKKEIVVLQPNKDGNGYVEFGGNRTFSEAEVELTHSYRTYEPEMKTQILDAVGVWELLRNVKIRSPFSNKVLKNFKIARENAWHFPDGGGDHVLGYKANKKQIEFLVKDMQRGLDKENLKIKEIQESRERQ